MVQEAPGAIWVWQATGTGKSDEDPSRVDSVNVSVLLVLVSVTNCGALVVLRLDCEGQRGGEMAKTGGCAIPVPLTANVCVGKVTPGLLGQQTGR